MEIDSIVDTRFLDKPLTEWTELFHRSNKVPYGPINDMKGVFENEQVRWPIAQATALEHPLPICS